MSVVIETTLGDVTVDLYLEKRPRTCLNFLKLCKIKYYNLCLFHKVERNFMAQNGDPTATGRGGESVFSHLYGEQAKYFDAELKPIMKHEKLGTLSMVNNGNNMNGSQFFITLGENLTYLDEVHTVFGEVTEGFDVLLKINEAICDTNYRPYQDIRITHTVVLHDPFEDPTALEIPPSSPVPTKEQLESNYIGADEEIDDTKGKSMEEVEEKIKESEAKARATILEMVGDIPDVDVKPPENVLFVCKLNPVTTSEDLEIIFSRFGTIKSCEVIKDKKSEESLQYAFIEFEREEDCESAYFKMDNVLIDDRRIHVDFSQSVSKLKWDNDKMPQTRDSRNRKQFALKDNIEKRDNYEMIFDTGEQASSRSKTSRKSRSKSPYRNKNTTRSNEYKSKYESKSSSSHDKKKHSSSYSRHRSPSPRHHSRRHKEKYSQRSPSVEKRHSRQSSHSHKRSHHSPSPVKHRRASKKHYESERHSSKKYKRHSRSSS